MKKQLLTLCVLVLSLFSITAGAQPTVGPTLPADAPNKGGYNIYSNDLEAETSTFLQPKWQFDNWGGGIPSEYTGIANNPCEQVANFKWVGIYGQELDLSNVDKLCLSVWSDVARSIRVFIINSGNITKGDAIEAPYGNISLTAGQWTTIEMPIATFKTNKPDIDLTKIDQIKIDNNGTDVPGDIYIDNVYFQFPVAGPLSYPTIPHYSTIVPILTSGSYSDQVSGWEVYNAGDNRSYSVGGHTIEHVTTNGGEVVYNPQDKPDLSSCNTFHVDVWPGEGVTKIYFKAYVNGADNIVAVAVTPFQWNSIDVPLNHNGAFQGIRFNDREGTGFTPGKSFYFTNVYAYNSASGTWEENIRESPDPTQVAKDVLPVFGNYFGNEKGHFSGWGDGAKINIENFKTDTSHKFCLATDFHYAGIDGLMNLDAHNYDRLHVDVYTDQTFQLRIVPKTANYNNDNGGQLVDVPANEWTRIDLDLTTIEGLDLAYAITQIGFYNGQGNTIAFDNVYFWNSKGLDVPASEDVDYPEGLNWQTTGTTDVPAGATCQVYRLIVPNDVNGNPAGGAHDGVIAINDHYYSTEMGEDDKWLVVQLQDAITVKDVELIWGNGYPKDYTVYTAEEWPIENGAVKESTLKKLYSVEGQEIRYDPYHDIHSRLTTSLPKARFVVIHCEKRGNDFFGFVFRELHIGKETSDYTDVDHVQMNDLYTKTGVENMLRNLVATPRNKRNAIVPNAATPSDVTITVEGVNGADPNFVKIEKNSNGTFNIYTTGAGEYILNYQSNGLLVGKSMLYSYKNWKESIIQGKTVTAGQTETKDGNLTNYLPEKVADWKESEDNTSRWSSGGESTAGANGGRDDEWLKIDLEKSYAIQEMEIVWENAYATSYDVYGFKEDPGSTDDELLALNSTANAANLIYSGKIDVTPDVFPYHDEHTVTKGNLISNTTNHARYLVIRFNKRGTNYGYSIWEIYANGTETDQLDAVDKLEAPNITMWAGTVRQQKITAVDSKNAENNIEGFHPVTMVITDASENVVSNEQIEIIDNTDGTYEVRGNTPGTYTVTMTAQNGLGKTMTGSFTVTVNSYKVPMALDPTKSTDTRQVYDEGYYSEEVLLANADKKVTSIDLRSVDFGSDVQISETKTLDLHNATIPAPRTLKNGDKQMNPNAIYYIDATKADVTAAENLAVQQITTDENGNTTSTWTIDDLRIFDGWDYAPIINEGGTTAKRARFYTSMKANKYSFIVIPFLVDYDKMLEKQVSLFNPTLYSPDRNTIRIHELTSSEFSAIEGKFPGCPFVIRTTNTELDSKDGYKLCIYSKGYENTIEASTPVSLQQTPINKSCDGDATFIGSYVENGTIATTGNGNNNYYFSSADEAFHPIAESTVVAPFYAYLRTPANATPAKLMFMLDTVDGIDEINTNTEPQIADVYDLLGRKVATKLNLATDLNRLPAGIYIVNGKKIVVK